MNIKQYDTRIGKELGFRKADVRKVISRLESIMYERILFGEDVYLAKIGTLGVKVAKPKRCFDINKSAFYQRPATMRPFFKPSLKLRNSVKVKTVYTEIKEYNENNQ